MHLALAMLLHAAPLVAPASNLRVVMLTDEALAVAAALPEMRRLVGREAVSLDRYYVAVEQTLGGWLVTFDLNDLDARDGSFAFFVARGSFAVHRESTDFSVRIPMRPLFQ